MMKRRLLPSPAWPTKTGAARPDTTVLSWMAADSAVDNIRQAAASKRRSTFMMRVAQLLRNLRSAFCLYNVPEASRASDDAIDLDVMLDRLCRYHDRIGHRHASACALRAG